MTRSASANTQAAVAQAATRPRLLIYMAWDTPRRINTGGVDISWDSQTWSASGARGENIDVNGGTLLLPNGEDDPWLNLVRTENPLERVIRVYQYTVDETASPEVGDAEQFFEGVMDRAEILVSGISIPLIESRQNKRFPPSSIEPPVYNWLLDVGDRIRWDDDIVTVS